MIKFYNYIILNVKTPDVGLPHSIISWILVCHHTTFYSHHYYINITYFPSHVFWSDIATLFQSHSLGQTLTFFQLSTQFCWQAEVNFDKAGLYHKNNKYFIIAWVKIHYYCNSFIFSILFNIP